MAAPRPPKLAHKVLQLLLDPAQKDFFLGDLDERFHDIAQDRSRWAATLWYWKQTGHATLTFGGGLLRGPGVQNLAAARRSLARHPLSTLGIVLVLGFGIGAVGTAFSVLKGTILRGLPFPEAHRLVHFERTNPEEGRLAMAVTPHDYLAWQEAQRSFQDLGAYVEAVALLPNEGAPPTRHNGVFISAGSFPLLDVAPARGRTFTPQDETPSAPPVVLLSHGLWSSRFGSDLRVVGTEIPLNGSPTTVVGVMPPGFGFPIAEEFWLPLRIDLTTLQRGQGRLDVFGRLRPGVSLEAATEDFQRIAMNLEKAYPATNANVRAVLKTFQDEYVGEEFQGTVWKMFLGAVLVLFICGANAANLLLLKGVRRKRDLALRAALGANRGSLVRLLLAEGLMLALGGALLGWGLVYLGVAWFNVAGAQAGVFHLPHGPASLFWWQVGPDLPTLLAVTVLAGGTGLAVSLLPALTVTGNRAAETLREEGRMGVNRKSARLTSGLVMAQVCLTTGLAVAGTLVVRSMENATQAHDLLPRPERVVTTRVDLPLAAAGISEGSFATLESRVDFAEDLLETLQGLPGVESAAIATDPPLGRPRLVPVAVEGVERGEEPPPVGVVTVSDGYFEALDLQALGGRLLESTDRSGSEPVALVNESFARRLLPGQDPLGARFRLGTPEEGDVWYRVVGLVPDLWDSPSDPAREAGVYLPLSQAPFGAPEVRLGWQSLRYQTILLRERPGTTLTAKAIQDAVYSVAPSLPLAPIRTLDDVARTRTGRYRVWGRFYLAFALAGLLLAGVGIYGVLASEVMARAPEISIRRALGASGSRVRAQVLRDSARRLAWGVGFGLVLGWIFAHGLTSVLYGVDEFDPGVYLAALGVMVGVGMAASWIPALWATRMDPLDALRG